MEKLPLLALSAASAIITIKAQQAGGAINPLNSYGLAVRLENALVAYVTYIAKAIWPTHLAAFYPYTAGSLRTGQVVASALFLLAVTALVIVMRRRRYLLVGWLWFLGTLVPMIGVVQVGDQAMADRYAYLPFLGLFIMICWGVADLFSKRTASKDDVQVREAGTGKGPSSIVLIAVSIAVLATLALLTHRQIGYWKDDVTLWSHAVQVTTGNHQAETYLGQAWLRRKIRTLRSRTFKPQLPCIPPAPQPICSWATPSNSRAIYGGRLRNTRKCSTSPKATVERPPGCECQRYRIWAMRIVQSENTRAARSAWSRRRN